MSEIIKKKIGEISKSVRYVNNITSPIKIKKIVDVPYYNTNGEYLIVIKNVESCELILNRNTTESIKIKVLTKVVIKTEDSLIDDLYTEVEIENGACIELENVDGSWYIISSDGMKLD
jgi:hypothetical protein